MTTPGALPKRVLMVAYYFPPLAGAGVQRSLKFARYLPDFGWQPHVLTVDSKSERLQDAAMKTEIPPSVAVFRTRIAQLPRQLPWRLRNFIARWLLLIDEHIGWYPFAVPMALKLIRSQSLQAIYTTSYPYTAHLIGLALKQRTGLPWVADFRDPWVDNFSAPPPTRWHAQFVLRQESKVVAQADRVLVVSEPMRQLFLAIHPDAPPGKLQVIPNGYDPDDFTNPPAVKQEENRLSIVYTGSFYGKHRTPEYFLRAVRLALDDRRIPAGQLRVRFIGNFSASLLDLVAAAGLEQVVEIVGYLPHREAVARLCAADLLLLIIGSGTGSQVVFTGKIFEYLAARKPILALIPPGAACDLIQDAGAGVIVPPEDIPSIARELSALYERWRQGKLAISPNEDVIRRYDRRLLTGRLANILDGLASKTAPHA